MIVARTKTLSVPELEDEAPEFFLPSAQGGQLQLNMRTARGPVVVVFYSGGWSDKDVAYFKDLATREDEINLTGTSIVGIGIGELHEARDFVRKTGIKSYILYDYSGTAVRDYGLLERDKEHGEYARPATFIVGPNHKVVHAWLEERPKAEEVLTKLSEITGLPKPAEEMEVEAGEKREKPSPEERERRRAKRQADREAATKGGAGNEPDSEPASE
jgi:peroxiredoxin